MKPSLKPVSIVSLLVLFHTGCVLASVPKDNGSAAPAEGSRRCIELYLINETEVIDDQTIVFHMLNNKAWINTLPYECPQLRIEDGFVHQTSLHRLCNVDIITVMNQGVSCGLGMFEPYSESDEKNSEENSGQYQSGD